MSSPLLKQQRLRLIEVRKQLLVTAETGKVVERQTGNKSIDDMAAESLDATKESIRVLLIDDQEEVRELLGAHLHFQDGIEVIGLAASGYEGIMMAVQHKPDIVLTDLRMPGINGIQTTKEIVKRCKERRPKIVMMTAFDDEEYVMEALEAGASGYLLKNTEIEDIANAIRLVHSGGGQQFAEKLEQTVLQRLHAYSVGDGSSPQRFMTERDHKIVQILARDCSNQQVADELGIPPREVQERIEQLQTQMNLAKREDLVNWCKGIKK